MNPPWRKSAPCSGLASPALCKIIGCYLDSAPTLLQRVRDAVAAGDGEALHQAAHSLKSSSANLGATQLAALCRELEQGGRERRLEDAAELFQALETHYLRAREALTVEMERERRATLASAGPGSLRV